MLPLLLWFLLAPLLPQETAEEVAAQAGATCERGCIVGMEDHWVYPISRDDTIWTLRMAHCEFEVALGTDEAPATMWQLVTDFYRRHLAGRKETFAAFVSSYSACTSKAWSTGGTHYSPRVTPIADVNRHLTWYEIPVKTRDFIRSFFAGEIANLHPSFCYVWTRHWESRADRRWSGPFYVIPPDSERSLNSYWADPVTRDWTADTVRIVGPVPR